MSDNKLANIGLFISKLCFAGILVCFSCPTAFAAPDSQQNQSFTDASLNTNSETPESASQRGFLSGIVNGYKGSHVKNPYRIYDKGVSPADLEKNLDDFTEQAFTAMDNNAVSPYFSSRDHDTDSLKKSWEWDFDVTDWGCEIQVNYEGDGNPVGELRNIVGCCDTQCTTLLWLVTDTITYPFPVGFVDTSRAQLSSALRRHPAYLSGDKTGDSPTPKPTPKSQPTPGKPTTTSDLGCGTEQFVSNADIDTDGRGNRNPGTTELPETSFQWSNGQSVPADEYAFIVMPRVPNGVDKKGNTIWSCPDAGKCAKVQYGGQTKFAFVGDCGPENKTGEVSMQLAAELGKAQDLERYPSGIAFGHKGDPNGEVTYTVFDTKIDKSNPTSSAEIQKACEAAAQKWEQECKDKVGNPVTNGATAPTDNSGNQSTSPVS